MGDNAKIGRGPRRSGAGNFYLARKERHQDCAIAAPRGNLPSLLLLSELGEEQKPWWW